jgi:hypothetical protein
MENNNFLFDDDFYGFEHTKQENKMELTKQQLTIIEVNRTTQHLTKRTCKEFAKILKTVRGEINNQCFCSQFERDTYSNYFYSEWDKINEKDDADEA